MHVEYTDDYRRIVIEIRLNRPARYFQITHRYDFYRFFFLPQHYLRYTVRLMRDYTYTVETMTETFRRPV